MQHLTDHIHNAIDVLYNLVELTYKLSINKNIY